MFQSPFPRRRALLRRRALFTGLCALLASAQATPARAPVQLQTPAGVSFGIDVLEARGFDVLQGQRVGLVTNPSGRARDGRATIDILRNATGVRLVALFGPEHGVRGDAAAGEEVANGRDAPSGLPIFSLYGTTRQPTSAMLRGLSALVFDLQDIGSRSYTFLATLEKCRLACAQNGVRLVVLDRPNPLGNGVEGNIPTQFSFVCPFPVPYRCGLTTGEVARFLNGRAAKKCALTVVPLQGYAGQTWERTGLSWTRTSPNIPRASSPFFYAATGILGETPALSIGIGTNFPFELAGAPGLDANALAKRLNARGLSGWSFRAVSWVPSKGAYAHKSCNGVQISLTDPTRAQATRLNFEIFAAVRQIAPRLRFFASASHNEMFDKVCGTTQIRRLMQGGASADTLWQTWNRGAAGWSKGAARYRLY